MLYLILIFIFGLIIGSFLNVCIYRIPLKKSIAWPPSHCTACENRLRTWHLVPIISWLVLRGKCGHCAAKISWRYPLVEMVTGFLYVYLYKLQGFTPILFESMFFVSLLLVISFIDIDHKIIPNILVILGIIVGLILGLLLRPDTLLFMVLGLLVGAGLLLAIAIISNGGMGGGDVKMAGMLGIYVGWQGVLTAIFVASLLGAIFGICYMLVTGKGRKSTVPFGPFLAVGGLLVYLHSEDLFNWYLRIMGM